MNMQRYKNLTTCQNLPSERRIETLSHFGFLVVIGLSAWFHGLRSTFGESAMVLFNLINEPIFFASSTWFSVHWFQNLITVLAIKANLSISLVSLVFSVSPMIFLYGVFLIINYVFRQKKSGIFLLLLFLGVNQTFFGAVHTPLILATTFYLVIAGFRTIWKKYVNDFSPFVQMIIWAIACLFLFTKVSSNAYSDVVEGAHNFSFIGYFSSVAISVFVISFVMMAYLVLLWIYKRQFKPLILMSFWSVLMIALIFIFGRKGLVDVNFELLFFPLIAGYIGFFISFLGHEFTRSATRFWILCILVIFAVFGQLRAFPDFEKRKNYVVRLLQHAPKTTDKLALPEHLQQLERYIDPTYLAFETALISSLRRLPMQSIFFIPADTTTSIPTIPTGKLNSSYFHFFNPTYIVRNTRIINRTLHKPPRDSAIKALRDTLVVICDSSQFALTVGLYLRRGDSVSLSVLRKGSDFGHLVISDNLPINTRLWLSEQYISEADYAGWQTLSTNLIIEKTDWHKTYLMNKNHKNERIYFKNFHIEIWRE